VAAASTDEETVAMVQGERECTVNVQCSVHYSLLLLN